VPLHNPWHYESKVKNLSPGRGPRLDSPVDVRLLGTFSLRIHGVDADACPGPVRLVLALLISASGREISRTYLAEQIWPDRDSETSLYYLRRTLTQLRKALGKERERIESPNPRTLRFASDGVFCDWSEFSRLALLANRPTLEKAVALYTGPFLPETRFEWADTQRQAAHVSLVEALSRLSDLQESDGDLQSASASCMRLISEDPLREESWRRFMVVLGRQSRYGQLSRVYEDLKKRFKREFGILPSRETSKLYADLLSEARLIASPGTAPPKRTSERPLQEPSLVAVALRSQANEPNDSLSLLRMANRFFPRWAECGRLPEAVAFAQEIFDAVPLEPSEELVELLFRSATACYSLYWLKETESLYRRAEQAADTLGLESWGTESLRARGDLAANQGRLQEAKALFLEAGIRYERAGDRAGYANCTRMLGFVAREGGDLVAARELTQAALQIHEETDDEMGQLWCIGSLGALYLELGEDEEALSTFAEALQLHRRIGNLPGEAWNLTMMAELEMRRGRPDAAKANLERALTIHLENSDNLARAWPLTLLGRAHLHGQDYESAELVLTEALEVSRASGSIKQTVESLIRLGSLAARKGDLAHARKRWQEASDASTGSEFRLLEAEIDQLGAQIANLERG
jgi:DNA-binding SARP family transcriptional activator/Tfp pilus assembly protein PilF